VKKIVIEHGGTIVAGESALGGAKLSIRLPLPPAAAPAEDAA
jgi:signal transduction histidine kinase